MTVPTQTLKKEDMKTKKEDIAKQQVGGLQDIKLTRKEAFKKAGYFAVSAATTMILLSNPLSAPAVSFPAPAPPPSGPFH